MHFICPKCKNECSSRLTVCPICGINFSEWIEKKKKDEKDTFLNRDSNIGKKANVTYSFEYGTKIIKTHFLKDKALDIVKVIIPETVKTIEEDAFWFFKNLETIEFEEAKKDITIELEDGAFNGLINLKRLKMPNVMINFKELFGSTIINLDELELYSNEHYEIDDVFDDDLYDFIHFDCEEIRSNEFENCNGIKKIIIGKGIEYISDEAFKNCKDLVSVLECNELIEIGNNAFEGCEKLKSIDLKDSLQKIGDNAFKNCYCLSKVKISPNTLLIGKNVFENCNITEIECPDAALEDNDYLNSVKTKSILNTSEATLFCKKMLCGKFQEKDYKEVIIPEGVEVITTEAFRKNNALERVVFPKTLKIIEKYAFDSCVNLKNVVFQEGIVNIADYAFRGCNIEEIILPKSLEELGKYAFHKNPIKSIKILGPVNKIGEKVFEWKNVCKVESPILSVSNFFVIFDTDSKSCNDKQIIISGNSDFIPDGYFSSDHGNCEYIFNAPIKRIGSCAFSSCKFNKIIIPDTVRIIGKEAFSFCNKLESIILPRDLEQIGSKAFSYCKSLKEVKMSDNIKKVMNDSFSWNNRITFVIPKTIKNISYFREILDIPWPSNSFYIRFCGSKKQWKKVIKNDKIAFKNNKHEFKKENIFFDE